MEALIRLALAGALVFGLVMAIRWVLTGILARVARIARGARTTPAALSMHEQMPRQMHELVPGRRRILILNALVFIALLMPWMDGSLLPMPLIFSLMLLWIYPLTCAWRERPMHAGAARLSAVSALAAAVVAVVFIATQSHAGIGTTASLGAPVYLLCAVAHVSCVSVYLRGQRVGHLVAPTAQP